MLFSLPCQLLTSALSSFTKQSLNKLISIENIVCGEGLISISKHHPKQLGKWFAYLKKREV
jgi:hypothetical protein